MTKPTKWHVCPAKTQISLGIRPVWSESALCAQWVAKDPSFLHADSTDADQTGWMDDQGDLSLRWVHRSFCWFCHEVAHIILIQVDFCIDLILAKLVLSFMIKLPYTISVNLIRGAFIETANCFWLHRHDWLWNHLSPVKRICVVELSIMTNFNCACPAIQRGQGSGFLSEGSSWLTACMSEQRRFWRDCADAQARLNLGCSHRR